VVNQTTLLMNETLAIIEHLRDVYRKKFGDDQRVGGSSRRDRRCMGQRKPARTPSQRKKNRPALSVTRPMWAWRRPG